MQSHCAKRGSQPCKYRSFSSQPHVLFCVRIYILIQKQVGVLNGIYEGKRIQRYGGAESA